MDQACHIYHVWSYHITADQSHHRTEENHINYISKHSQHASTHTHKHQQTHTKHTITWSTLTGCIEWLPHPTYPQPVYTQSYWALQELTFTWNITWYDMTWSGPTWYLELRIDPSCGMLKLESAGLCVWFGVLCVFGCLTNICWCSTRCSHGPISFRIPKFGKSKISNFHFPQTWWWRMGWVRNSIQQVFLIPHTTWNTTQRKDMHTSWHIVMTTWSCQTELMNMTDTAWHDIHWQVLNPDEQSHANVNMRFQTQFDEWEWKHHVLNDIPHDTWHDMTWQANDEVTEHARKWICICTFALTTKHSHMHNSIK